MPFNIGSVMYARKERRASQAGEREVKDRNGKDRWRERHLGRGSLGGGDGGGSGGWAEEGCC